MFILNSQQAAKKTALLLFIFINTFFVYPLKSMASQINPIRFKHLTVDDGLSHNAVARFGAGGIVQDKQGFLWFAAPNGLNRFDGSDFRVFRPDPNNRNSHLNNIYSLFEDSNGLLWTGTRAGLMRFDPSTEKFSQALPVFSKTVFADIAEDKNGHLWLASAKEGLIKYNPKAKTYKQYTHDKDDPKSLSSNNLYAVHTAQNGAIWIGSRSGLNRFDTDTKQFKRFTHQKAEPNSLSSNVITMIREDQSGNLWLGTYNGLNRFDKKRQQFTRFLRKSSSVQSTIGGEISNVLPDHDGNIWVAIFNKGICQLDVQSGACTTLHYHDPSENTSLPNDRPTELFQDKQKTIWVATHDGLSYFRPNQKHFNYIPHKVKVGERNLQQFINTLMYDSQGRLWVGGRHGLSRYDTQTRNFKHFTHIESDPNSLSSDFVFSILEDSNQIIWVSGHGGHLNRYDPKHDHFIRYSSGPTRTYVLYETPNGQFWLGDDSGIIEFDRTTNTFINRSEALGVNSAVTKILSDHTGDLWFNTYYQGLWQVKPDLSYTVHKHSNQDSNSLSHSRVLSLYEDKKNRLWIGTANGLNQFDRQHQHFKRFQLRDPLLENITISAGITEDKNGNLWMISESGIITFDPLNGKQTHFSTDDGLLKQYSSTVTKSPKGEILYGGPHGITRFFPEHIINDNVKPKLIFTKLKSINDAIKVNETVNKQVLLPQAITQLDELYLNEKNNSFTIAFSALNARHAKKLEYAYQLKGWDKEWIKTPFKNREARYTNVAAGNYSLAVLVKDINTEWQESIGSISITIAPSWWQTYWAKACYLLGVLISIYFLVRLRTQYLTRKTEQLETKVKSRTLEIAKQKETIESLLHRKDILFANVSHEFRTPITLISIPIANAIKAASGKKVQSILAPALINITRLKKMVDQLIDLARLDIHASPNYTTLDLACILEYIVDSLQSLIDERALQIDRQWQNDLWVNASEDILEKIIINLLSNAIKYTPDNGKIIISANKDSRQVHLSITDNGIGMEPADHEKIFERFTRLDNNDTESVPGAGIGLALVKQLVEALEGSIEVTSKIKEGASFTIKLPQAKDHEKNKNNLPYSHDIKDIIQQEFELLSTKKPKQAHDNEVIKHTETHKAKVLIVEDHPEMLNLLKETLSPHYECLLAAEGTEGIQKAVEIVPDLILTDLMMPNLSGIELSKMIRKDIRTSHIPIILLTAKSDLESRLSAWQTNIDDYIEKPFNIDELLLRCQNLLNIRKIISTQLSRNIVNFNAEEKFTDNRKCMALLNDKDQNFVNNLDNLIASNFKNSTLGVKEIAKGLAMSDSQLHRKMKALLNQSISEYLRTYRLLQGAELLSRGNSVTEVALDVGFSSSSYFSSCFKAHFGLSPKQYQTKGNTPSIN